MTPAKALQCCPGHTPQNVTYVVVVPDERDDVGRVVGEFADSGALYEGAQLLVHVNLVLRHGEDHVHLEYRDTVSERETERGGKERERVMTERESERERKEGGRERDRVREETQREREL